MRAIFVRRFGNADVLQLDELRDPVAGAGQLLVEVAAAGVNYRDTVERSGRAVGVRPPFIPGSEGVGRVREVGAGVQEFRVGDRVGWIAAPGSYAELVLVEEALAVAIPPDVSDAIAGACLLQGITAQFLTTSCVEVGSGDTVLVHAGAGGVGQMLTQVSKLRGARVIATASSELKRSRATSRGADFAIGYEDFPARVRSLTDGRGVDVVYDGVGKDTLVGSLNCLRPRGHMVMYGASSGSVASLGIPDLGAASLFFTRPSIRHYTGSRSDLLLHAEAVLHMLEKGVLHADITSYSLAEASRAHSALEARETIGKLILEV